MKRNEKTPLNNPVQRRRCLLCFSLYAGFRDCQRFFFNCEIFDEIPQKVFHSEAVFWKYAVFVCRISYLTAKKNRRIIALMSKGVHFRTEFRAEMGVFSFYRKIGKKELS
jgi:hypothetical protein